MGSLLKGQRSDYVRCACAGAAGSFIVQFAKRAGAKVVTTVGTTRKAEVAKVLGADVVINHRSQDVSEALAEACPEGLDWVVDGVGGHLQDSLIQHMKPGATMLQIGYIAEYPHTRVQPCCAMVRHVMAGHTANRVALTIML